MYLRCFDDVKQLTKDLVRIPSIVKTSGEADCARAIHDYYRNLPYFQDYPEQLLLQQTTNDEIERYNVIGLVRGTGGNSNRTVILMSHFDTVGVDDFGVLKEHAFNPDALPSLLRQLNLGNDVNDDIDSGDYMFGRGALDMKSGVAGHMVLVKHMTEHLGDYDGNIVLIAACDEEDNSHGIISSLDVLQQWKSEYGLEYIAAINADYSTPHDDADNNAYVYLGTIGKLLPSFYVAGKEMHVGAAFSGLDPNMLVAELNRHIQLNPELSDAAHGQVTIPPVSLKQADFKQGYTVQTALDAFAYYNFFTYRMSPHDVMVRMKEKATEAFESAIQQTNDAYRTFCERSGQPYTELPWRSRVYTWDELHAELVAHHGDAYTDHIRAYAAELQQSDPTMDLREFSVRIVQEAWQWAPVKEPAIIIYYSSTYSASIDLTGKTEQERELLASVNEAIAYVQPHADKRIQTKMFYPYISDASFMSTGGDAADLVALESNMPAWGTKYVHPTAAILAVNTPVVNIGTFGKDGHKFTERVHMQHTFEVVPNVTYHTVLTLLAGPG